MYKELKENVRVMCPQIEIPIERKYTHIYMHNSLFFIRIDGGQKVVGLHIQNAERQLSTKISVSNNIVLLK